MDQTDGSASEDGSGEINNETQVSDGVMDPTFNGQSDVPDETNGPGIVVRASCNQARQSAHDVESASSVASLESDDIDTLEPQPGHVLVNGSSGLVAEVENGADILKSEHYVNRDITGEVGQVGERVSYIPNSTSGPVDGTVDVSSIIASVTQRKLNTVDSAVSLPEGDNQDVQCFTQGEKYSENPNFSTAHAESEAESTEPVTPEVCINDHLTDVGSTQQTSAEVGNIQQTSAEVENTQQTSAEVESTRQTSAEVESTQKTSAEVGSTQQTSAEVGSIQQTSGEDGSAQQPSAEVDSEGIINFRKVVQEFLDGIKDQIPIEDPPETTESLAEFVQENIASKNIRTIRYTLKDLTEAERKAVVEHEIDGKTALFVACEKGTDETVKYFVTECGADINKKGKYDCGGKDMLVAPLWLATIEEKPEVVKILADHGADVNAICTTGSTAVHAACYMNNTELVEALCNSGSDVNIPDTLGSTCLKDSVDNLEICKVLIAHGADVNYTKENQYSVLHHAIKAHNMETVELLVRNGADIMTEDFEGNDCLRYAILVYSPDIVEFLMDSINANAPKSADIYDLMGAVAVGRGEYKEGYEYWLRSMYIRTELHGGETSLREIPEIFEKDVTVPHSISDLILLAKNCDAMDALALAITSHQLGPTHWDTIQRILLQSTSLLHNDNLIQAFDMTRHVYSLLMNKYKILHRMQEFALSQLFEICSKFQIQTLRGVSIPRFKEILEIFKDMVDFLEKAHLLKRSDTEYFIQNANIFDKVIDHVFDMMYLLKVNNKSSDEKCFFKSQMKRLVEMELCDINGVSLLHKSLTRKPKIVFHFMETGPREARHEDLCVTRELIQAGANVNVQDLKRDTPLHSHLKWIEKYNFFTKKIIELFLDYGAHVDLVDIDNNSLFAMINARGLTICPVKYHTLQCLAVKVIRDQRIHFRSLLPIPLQRFVDMHK